MDDRKAFARACAIASEHGNAAADVVARRLAAALKNANKQEADVWRSVGKALAQIDMIACCKFAVDDVAVAASLKRHPRAASVPSPSSDI